MSQSYENFGKYILLEKLAMGGMAEVYLARNTGAGGIAKFIAIKRILPQFSENAEFIDMFKDEAKIAINLSHSNIVSLYEFGIEKGQFFIVMDYVEGRNLRQILNKMKKSGVAFSVEQALYIVKEVAAGLDAAHRCLDTNTGKPLNIIHRDMSPQNVMISFEGEVKIVDFGIAKAETQLETTRAGTLKGKFGYMSPEQAEGLSVDLRTDIFSLGILLWELLANDRLFVANNEVNTLRKIRDCQIPSLRKINPNIPPELERIVSKALAKDRNLRYQTGEAFQRDLSRFLNRQYPDFSPQDFSVYIKTLFSGEILETRKKTVEYAKIDTGASSLSTSELVLNDKTVVTMTGTITDTGTDPELDFGNTNHSGRKKGQSQKMPPSLPSFDPLFAAQGLEAPKPPEPAQPMRMERLDRPTTSTGSVREGSFTGSHPSQYITRTSSYGKASSKGFSYKPLFAVLGIGAIIGGVYFAAANPKTTITLLQEWGVLMPAQPKTGIASNLPSVAPKKYEIAVTSSPGGAVILVDGRPVGEITPARLSFEEGQTVKITVNLSGYLPYEEFIEVKGPASVNAALKADRKGRIDVNVVGAGEISVNGKVVAQGSPANNIEVPADEEVLVSVYDPITKAQDAVRVTVAPHGRKKITLIPRAPSAQKPDLSKKQ